MNLLRVSSITSSTSLSSSICFITPFTAFSAFCVACLRCASSDIKRSTCVFLPGKSPLSNFNSGLFSKIGFCTILILFNFIPGFAVSSISSSMQTETFFFLSGAASSSISTSFLAHIYSSTLNNSILITNTCFSSGFSSPLFRTGLSSSFTFMILYVLKFKNL